MSKAKIIDKKSIESILGEKRILSELHHPFIVNMIYSFQDFDYLYLVMEILQGGNLRYHLSIRKRFNENQVKFIIGCIMIGLKYIHGRNILHRDIKPENLVFDTKGYLRITDFGIAKHYVVNNKKDTSGTIGYLAPEVLCNVNHNFSIDYYAVGIITYELMYGHRPYLGKNKNEVKQLILTRQAKIDIDDLPEGFSNDIADFINKLIQRKPKNRLGKNDINEVLNHPWFDDFDWENCNDKKLRAPYIPKYGDNFDKNYCLQSNKIGTETMERYEKIMSKENIHMIFKEFNCTKIPKELKGYNNKKNNEGVYFSNNNISSNMSTTSISRNNKSEKKQINFIAYNNNNNNMNYNYKNLIKNKILNKDIENIIMRNNNLNKSIGFLNKTNFEINQNKYLNYLRQKNNEDNNNNLNNFNITYKHDHMNNKNNFSGDIVNNNLDISGIFNHRHNNNMNKIQKSIDDIIDNEHENLIYEKNNIMNNKNQIIKKKEHLNRNISARNLNHNREKISFNNSTMNTRNQKMNMNSGIISKMRQQEYISYKSKKNKYTNHSTKSSKAKKTSNNLYNSQFNNSNNIYYNKINNKNIYQPSKIAGMKKNTSISIPKTKRDFIRKDLIRNQTLYFPVHNNQSNYNINVMNNKKNTQNLISSSVYTKKKNNSIEYSRISQKRLNSSNSMQNFNEINYMIGDNINNNNNLSLGKSKSNSIYSINPSRSSKNIMSFDKRLPFLNLSLGKKNDLESNSGRNDAYIKFNKYKNSTKYESASNEPIKNGSNYDILTDRLKNRKIKNGKNYKL